jgi:aromatic ring-cleaving dioxygenase
MSMAIDQAAEQPVAGITGYHAHVHYDPGTKPVAAQLRDAVARPSRSAWGAGTMRRSGRTPAAAIRSRSHPGCRVSWSRGSR